MSEKWEKRLKAAVSGLTLEEADREYILRQCALKQGMAAARRRAALKGAAAFFLCGLLLGLYWMRTGDTKAAVVYAATGEEEWTRLELGQKQKLLKIRKEEGGREKVLCVFRLELSDRYLFEREGIVMGEDFITIKNEKIYWEIGETEDLKEESPSVLESSMRIRIVDQKGNRAATLELIMTREGEECYAQLRRLS